MCMRLNYKMASTSSNKIKLAAGVEGIFRWQTRSKGHLLEPNGFTCSISSEVVMIVSAVSRAARAGSALCLAQLASTPNQVLNRSCMVAIPIQNKKEMLNNER